MVIREELTMAFHEPRVSVVKCADYHQVSTVKESVRAVAGLIGGLESIISPGDSVLIKPNFVAAHDYRTGATTNPNVIWAIAELCREVGAKKISVADGSAVGNDADRVYDQLGLRELAREYHCELVNIAKDEFTYVLNPLGRNIKRIRLPRVFIESNVVINVPVMKTHDALAVTLGLKNMKGIIHPSDKKRFHKWGLAQTIVDLGHLALPELTIMDGTVALEGMGPVVGKPVNLGLLLASTDTVAVDRVCLEIMGFSLDEIEYIRLAGEQGLGCADLSEITLLGAELPELIRPFARVSLDRKALAEMGITVVECDACSGCNNMVNSFLYDLSRKGQLEMLRDCTLVYGQNPRLPEREEGRRIIRLGVCTRNAPFQEGVYVPGCPPHPLHVKDFLANRGFEAE
jgi:uncharacterized protein (DUF362 family)